MPKSRKANEEEKMSFDTLQKSHLIVKILSCIGLLTSETFRKRFPTVPVIYYKLMIHVPLGFTYTICMWLEVVFSEDLKQANDVLYMALTESVLMVKILTIWYHDELAKSLLDAWQHDEMFELRTTEECVMWQRTMNKFGIVAFLYIACSLGVVISAFIAALFSHTLQIPYPYWTPFNAEDPSKFWYAYFYELFAMPLTCLSNCTMDSFFCYMIQHLALHFKVMAMRLEKLGTDAKGVDKNMEITKKLVTLIKHNLKLKSMSRECEAIVSYPILAQILMSALVLCFSLYRLQNFNALADPVNFLSLILYAVVMTLQIYLPCHYANNLTIESAAVLNSIYNSNWSEMSAYNRRLILLYMQSLQKPVILKAGVFFDIGLPTFSKTMNNAYSFFALLLNMDND